MRWTPATTQKSTEKSKYATMFALVYDIFWRVKGKKWQAFMLCTPPPPKFLQLGGLVLKQGKLGNLMRSGAELVHASLSLAKV